MRKRKLQQSLIEKLEANLVNIETLVASALQAVTF
jgi:S-adenosylmethionine:tRNA-ribosyltransferase-isomerase (queuine synthetase)